MKTEGYSARSSICPMTIVLNSSRPILFQTACNGLVILRYHIYHDYQTAIKSNLDSQKAEAYCARQSVMIQMQFIIKQELCRIIFPTNRVKVMNKLLLANLYQYCGNFDLKKCPARGNWKFKIFRCLKTKFEAKKTTQGNAFITHYFKIFLGLNFFYFLFIYLFIYFLGRQGG